MRMVSGQFVPSSAGLKPMAGSICSSRKVPPRLGSWAWARRNARVPWTATPAAVAAMNARRLTMASLLGHRANATNLNQASASRVQVLARRGLRPADPVPLLAQQELVQPDRAAREGHRGAGEVEQPGAVRALAHDGARLVGAGLQPLHPLPAGA